MASHVVLERHLWLMLTEIKEADKVPVLNATISPTGLFGPTVEGFAGLEALPAEKSRLLVRSPKASSNSAAGESHATCYTDVSESRARQCSRSGKRFPHPQCQGPWQKSTLDSAPPTVP